MAHRLRIRFSKHAHMVFIGHLDLMRYFQKAMRRSKVDIAYSAGFSPHQIMSFAQPLGVGIYSEGEYMDITVVNLETCEKVRQSLQSVMAEGVDVISVIELPEGAVNSMASVAAAGYRVYFRQGHKPDFSIKDAIENLMHQNEINIIKETKKGSRELNLKEHIYELKYEEHPENGSDDNHDVSFDIPGADKTAGCIYMLLDASSGGNIKPALVMEQIYRFMNKEAGRFDMIVKRTDLYERRSTADAQEWISLGEVGI